VRGLEGFKVFEMPLLGFLGFPALALDSMAAFAMFSSLFLGNRSWERPEDLSYRLSLHPERSRRFFWAMALLQALFWASVSSVGTSTSVASWQLEMSDLGLTADELAGLRERGITRPRQFLRATDTAAERAILRHLFQENDERLLTLRRRAELYTFKGIGRDHGQALESIGVHAPEDFRHWNADQLLAQLSSRSWPRHIAPPRLDFVRVWIQAAPQNEEE
jgi:hypothetical protein